ncbi:MAG: TonB-dependent receptor, partial [Bryobacteraceae bacterium]
GGMPPTGGSTQGVNRDERPRCVHNLGGNFIVQYLLPGIYTVEAEAPGFKRFIRSDIHVRIGDMVEVNFMMELGDTSTAVEVKDEPPLLPTAESSLGLVVDSRRIIELPVFGSSPYSLVLLAPGVVNTTNMRQRTTGTPGAQSDFSSEGAGRNKNEFTIDGVPNTQDQIISFVPPQAAVAEFKVQTAIYDASIGRILGSVVNVGIKSGGNQLRGEAYWVVRNRFFDAKSIFQNRSGANLPVYQDNRYGIAVGGPVIVPKLYRGTNKTFWFYNWEENPNKNPSDWLGAVPTEAQRRGDLSALPQIYDPFSGTQEPNGRIRRQPVPGNIIPASRIDPVARKLLDFWPMPNAPGTVQGQNNHMVTFAGSFPDWNHLARVDHAFSDRHRSYIRIWRNAWMSDFGRSMLNDWDGTQNRRNTRGFALDDVYMFSPTFLLNVRYGFTQQDYSTYRNSRGFDLSTLGFSPSLVGLVPDRSRATLPRVNVTPWKQLSNWAATRGDSDRSWVTHTLNANLTKMTGDHKIRFGADFRVYREFENVYALDVSPWFTSTANFTRGPLDSSPNPAIGGQVASFLFGIPEGSMSRSANFAQQDKFLGLYIHDDFKVTPKLTLNMGLRYEIEAPITERFNRSVAQYAFYKRSPVEEQARANYAARPDPALPVDQFRLMGGLTFAGVGGNPRQFWRGERNNFLPRFGFAYLLRPKTVLRGGYGIYYDSVGVNVTNAIQTGFGITTPMLPSLDNGLSFVATMSNPFPNGLLAPLGAGNGLNTALGQSISFFPEVMKQGYAQRWSLNVTRELPGRFVMEVGYMGNRGTRLPVTRDVNALPLEHLSRSPVRDQTTINYLSANVPNPLFGLDPVYTQNIPRSVLLTPYPHFRSMNMVEPTGYSWYHALATQVEKRFSKGFTFQGTYTWSKTMEAVARLNAADPVPYETLSTQDRAHRVVLNGLWEIPFGRSRHFGGSWPKALDFFAGGWQFSALVQK